MNRSGILIVLSLWFPLTACYGDVVVTSCQSGSGKSLQLIKGKTITQDIGIYYISLNGKKNPLLGSLHNSTGSLMLSRCIGEGNGGILVAGEFSSNYIEGSALSYKTNQVVRVYFAERTLPKWVYLGKTSIKVIIPNEGNEQRGKYLLYSSDHKQQQGRGIDTLPSSRGFQVIEVSKVSKDVNH
jgi:hypothetical protein